MPYLHRYICANPVECPNRDNNMKKIRLQKIQHYSEDAHYMVASYYYSHMNIDGQCWWW